MAMKHQICSSVNYSISRCNKRARMKRVGRSDVLTLFVRRFGRRRWSMGQAKLVNVGVDTLMLNAFYTDERGRPVKYDLDESLRLQLDAWKREAQAFHVECPTTLVFNEAVLHMCPNGVGQGQWPWMLKTKDITLYISGGHWNGIASVRFSSQYLWSCRSTRDAMVSMQAFLDDLFKQAV